jgi:hypothetical protein
MSRAVIGNWSYLWNKKVAGKPLDIKRESDMKENYEFIEKNHND